jgi:hypothetical protein
VADRGCPHLLGAGQPDQKRERFCVRLCGVVRAREQCAAGDIGLRRRDVPIEGRSASERLGARITQPEHAPLHVDAGHDSRRVGTDLHHDLTAISQHEPDDHAEISGPEYFAVGGLPRCSVHHSARRAGSTSGTRGDTRSSSHLSAAPESSRDNLQRKMSRMAVRT